MSESLLAARVFAAMKDIVLVLGRDGEYVKVPTTGADGLYAPSEALVGRNVREILPAREAEEVCAVIHAALDADEPVTFEYSLPIRDRVVQFAATVTKLDDNAVVWVARDVTVVREQLVALRASESRYRFLFERNPAPMWTYDEDTLAFLDVNDAAVSHYGFTREEFLRMTVRDIVDPDGLEESPNGKVASMRSQPERCRHRRKDGQVMDVEIMTDVAEALGRRARIVLATDVTERLRMEAQLRHAEKLEALGTVAGGIAHDFNNVLTSILGHAEFLIQDLPANDERRKDALVIQHSSRRAALLTQQLLAFSKRQTLRPRLQRMNSVITGMHGTLHRLMGEHVRLIMRLDARPDAIIVDRSQLEQVVANLCVNAREAMPAGGTLTIATQIVTLDEEEGVVRGLTQGARYVCLRVSDTGIGIPDRILPHIFEPFFTTKARRPASGLGLSTVHGIIAQSGGSVTVVATPGAGATFEILLPAAEEPVRASPPLEAGVAPSVPRADETVLLVEDEQSVRALAHRILARCGYRVLEAENGHEALALAEKYDGPIQVLLTDAVMPHMNGSQLAQRIVESRPAIRVLFMTGHTDNEAVRVELANSGHPVIEKPFGIDSLTAAMRRVLEDAPELQLAIKV